MDLQEFIQGLQTEAQRESSGTFTIDPTEARKKLRRYQLASPYAYIGALLAAANLAGVHRVTLSVTPDQVVMECPQFQLDRTQLDDLLSHLLVDRAPRHLRELALATNGALALGPVSVEVTSGTFHKAFRGETESLGPAPKPVEGLRFCVRYRALQRLRRRLLRDCPEEGMVHRYCGFAVADLQFNGQPVRPPLPASRCLIKGFLQGYPAQFDSQLKAIAPTSELTKVFAGQGPHGGVLALFDAAQPNCGLELVVEGLTFRLPNANLGLAGAWCKLIAPQFRRDLSGFSLVRCAEMDQLVASLVPYFLQLRSNLVENMSALNATARFDARGGFVEQAFDLWARGDRVGSLALFRSIRSSYQVMGAAPDPILVRVLFAISIIAISVHDDRLSDAQIHEIYEAFAAAAERVYGVSIGENLSDNRGTVKFRERQMENLGDVGIHGLLEIFKKPEKPEALVALLVQVSRAILGEDHSHTLYYRHLYRYLAFDLLAFLKIRPQVDIDETGPTGHKRK